MRVLLTVSVAIFAIGPCRLVFTIGSQEYDKLNHCNNTRCTYSVSAEYAQCKSLGLVQIPSQCSSAVYLDIRKNDLRYLDSTSLTNFVKLKYLYLDGNQIKNITPRAFEACPTLQQIFLQHNPIIIIRGEVFAGLTDLRYLYLNQVQLAMIYPRAFDDLLALERLYLSDNTLESLPHDLFHRLTNLQVLTLANNRLKTLASDTFQGLLRLEYLDIKQNQLTFLPNGLFDGMPLLNRLTLSYNSISNIEKGAINFTELRSLETLDMQNNTITTVGNFSSDLPSISQLFFAGNPIYCDCHTEWLRVWYQLKQDSSIIHDLRANVTCHGPQSFEGQLLKNITATSLPCVKVEPTTTKPENGTTPKPLARYTSPGVKLLVESPDRENTAYVGQTDQPKSDQNVTTVKYIGIGALVVCIIITIIILGFAFKKCQHSCGLENPQEPKENKNKPNAETRLTLTENPLSEHSGGNVDYYEHIPNAPPVPPHANQNRLPSDSTYPDSGTEEDFPPDTEVNDFPPQPLPPPPSQPNSVSSPQSCYIPHTVTQPLLTHSSLPSQKPLLMPSFPQPPKQPQPMHSQSQPLHVSPGGNFYPQSNPFTAPIQQTQTQMNSNQNMQLQNLDLNNNTQNCIWPSTYQVEIGQNQQQLHTHTPTQTLISDYCKHSFQPQSTNPFIIS